MYSRDHAILSLLIAAAGLAVLDLPFSWPVALVVALVAGVGIDFDHFVVAALVTGSSKNVRRVLGNPTLVIVGQDRIFDAGDLTEEQRLLSHVVIAGVAVTALWFPARYWAFVVAVTLYAHVLADLVADVRVELAAEESPTAR